jgi:ankyrin repeat protein
LHFAAFKDLPLHCSLLYRRGASLEPKDYQGMTPLDVAIQHQQADAVTILRLCKLAAEVSSSLLLLFPSFALH